MGDVETINGAATRPCFVPARSGFSTREATSSGRSISAKRTENCRAAELFQTAETRSTAILLVVAGLLFS
jgi:hypothetical protein